MKKKARIKWDLEGELNTKFFHMHVQYRRRRNFIHGVSVNNQWIEEPDAVKYNFFQFFKGLFTPKFIVLRLHLFSLPT